MVCMVTADSCCIWFSKTKLQIMLGVDQSSGIFRIESDPISYNINMLYLVRPENIPGIVVCVDVVLLCVPVLVTYTADELAHLSPVIAHALKTRAEELSPIAQALKISADALPPIAQALKTCADELSPTAQASKTCINELPPVAQTGENMRSSCSSYSSSRG